MSHTLHSEKLNDALYYYFEKSFNSYMTYLCTFDAK